MHESKDVYQIHGIFVLDGLSSCYSQKRDFPGSNDVSFIGTVDFRIAHHSFSITEIVVKVFF